MMRKMDDYWYVFNGLPANFGYKTPMTFEDSSGIHEHTNSDLKFSVLFPYHLFSFSDNSAQVYDSFYGITHTPGSTYEAEYPKEVFYEFYKKTGRYDMSLTDSGIIIYGYSDGYDMGNWPSLPNPVEFVFEDREHRIFVTIREVL